jgi:hypothetical protein
LRRDQKRADTSADLRLRLEQHREQPVLRSDLGPCFHALALLFAQHADRVFDQVADDRFHIAAHVADLGELRGFHLDERRLRELGQAARDLGFADTGRADHDDVLGHDLVAQLGRS